MTTYTVTLNDSRHADMRPEVYRVIEAESPLHALHDAGMPDHFATNDGASYTSTVAPYSVWTVSPTE